MFRSIGSNNKRGTDLMKKFISVIAAAVLTAAIGFSFAGCGKKDVQNAPTEAATEHVEEIRFGYVDCEADDVLLDAWLADEYKYSSIIADDFGLGAEGAKKFYESAYYAYGVSVEIVNNTDFPIEVTGIESDVNGNANVYIRKDFSGGEIGVDAHSSSAATLQVICADENADDEQVIAEIRNRTYVLNYTQKNEEKSFAVVLEDGVEVYKKPSNTDEIIRFGDGGFVFSEALWEKYKDDTEANRSALKAGFGVDDSFLNEFYKESESYNFFNYPVLIENMTEQDLVVLDVATENDGSDGIYVNVALSSEMGIPAYNPYADYVLPTFALQVLCDNDDLYDEEVQSIVNAMEFTVTYAAKTADGEPDYNNKQTITVTIG